MKTPPIVSPREWDAARQERLRTTDSAVGIVRSGTAPGGHGGSQVAGHIRRISGTISWPAVTVRDMSRRWP